MGYVKYTKEILQEAVESSKNYSDVLRYLGIYSWSGSQWLHIKKRIAYFKINTAHFGTNPKSTQSQKKHFTEILVKQPKEKGRADNRQLRRACIEVGLEYKCECGLPPKWKGKELTLEIDHINGDWSDNRIENLRFLCPNCHSQTDTYKKSPQIHLCADCEVQITRAAKRCKKCAGKIHSKLMKSIKKTKIDWPPQNALIEMVNRSNKAAVAKKLGVSEAAVRKRLKTRRELAGESTTPTR